MPNMTELWAFIDAEDDDRPDCSGLRCPNRARLIRYNVNTWIGRPFCLICAKQGRVFNRRIRRLIAARKRRTRRA